VSVSFWIVVAFVAGFECGLAMAWLMITARG